MRGFNYQANYAWLFICSMLMKHSHIEYIEYEAEGNKSFDDIIVHFHREKPRLDCNNNPIYIECYQVKFHVDYSSVLTLTNLMDPAFIGAKTKSILNRLKEICTKYNHESDIARFFFISSYLADPKDVLAELLSTKEGEFRLEKLFDGTTSKSRMGIIREELIRHMQLESSQELENVLATFRIIINTGTEYDLIIRLNGLLAAVNLKPIDISTNVNPYQQLIQTWTNKDIKTITPSFVIDECKKADLFLKQEENTARLIGIRSFYRWAENMQDETETMLCLVECFDGRFLKEGFDWETVCNRIEQYIQENLDTKSTYNMFLDTHLCISFYAGRFLNPKSGICVYPIQKVPGQGIQVWIYNSQPSSDQLPDWVFKKETASVDSKDTILIISVTHEISPSVKEYLEQTNLTYSYILKCNFPSKCSNTCIQEGNHAKALAESIIRELSKRTMQQKSGRVHIFMAVPVAFAFFLGQMSLGLGRVTLYEYDFEGKYHATYYPAITFLL
jgi:hypothetical protein